ncbi:TetR/AcrR family transcriptional regulator [Streptomyces sp. NPDC016845]|uniref:TetR/AcrR family transcriptional regulator n=1 Tax=Streptomyces sp. NPDC016845 TaxID=3364972 RepID=UPI0037B67284
MPIEVDEVQRLDEIAAATIEVARERGVRAVTIRAVAQRLGGSTAMVTNYIPSRSALMANALRRADKEWGHQEEEALKGTADDDRLPALLRWMCTTTADDEVMRRLLFEIISEGPAAGKEVEQVRDSTARAHREGFRELATEAGLPSAAEAGDILHLLLRGYWLSTLEDPQSWPAERGTHIALTVLEMLRRGLPDLPTTT